MLAARALALVVAFLVGFGVKGATGGGDSGPSDADKAKLSSAQASAKRASAQLTALRRQLAEAKGDLQLVTKRDRGAARTERRLRARARKLRRALTRARKRR